MKHLFFIISFVAFIGSKSFAKELPVPSALLQSFQTNFASAKDVKWEKNQEFTLASFNINGKKKIAYYNEAFELVVVAEPIQIEQLSEELNAGLQANLNGKYSHFAVTEIYKLKGVDGIHFCAMFENEKETVILRSSSDSWEVMKKQHK